VRSVAVDRTVDVVVEDIDLPGRRF
jgi:hypothetical protein